MNFYDQKSYCHCLMIFLYFVMNETTTSLIDVLSLDWKQRIRVCLWVVWKCFWSLTFCQVIRTIIADDMFQKDFIWTNTLLCNDISFCGWESSDCMLSCHHFSILCEWCCTLILLNSQAINEHFCHRDTTCLLSLFVLLDHKTCLNAQ